MKAAIIFLYLFFLLPSGNHNLYANVKHKKSSFSSNQHFVKNQQNSILSNEQSITLFEENDFDQEEDYHSGDDSKPKNKTFSVSKNNFLSNNYHNEATLFALNNYTRFKFFELFCPNTTPIYITLRVLRI
jgi:hypothetical protein